LRADSIGPANFRFGIANFGFWEFCISIRIPQFHWGVFKSFDLETSFCYDSVNFSFGQIPAAKKYRFLVKNFPIRLDQENFDQKRRTRSGSYGTRELRERSYMHLAHRPGRRGKALKIKKELIFFSKWSE